MVFLEIERNAEVAIPFSVINSGAHTQDDIIFLDLHHKSTSEKTSKENGYCVAVTGISPISTMHIDHVSYQVLLPINFSYTTMKPCKGEILIGTITEIKQNGIILKSGPMKNIFLSKIRMEDYEFRPFNEPMFLKVNGLSYMKKGTKVRFRVLSVIWIQSEEEFNIGATILGDYIGPI
ncbi:DNA-directed RNA polymerase V subunit 7-like [Dendrobium catenatum]|uniref:DNA-directed RNA polymerase subunit n=1 Tax=Dendrobium catenatum TaxID=906689 RepID=A0A2I0VXE9_9ASPA|nr:DNA-directed RNA polymerase V subunit 7-like [Dendrobium catenatum]PKU68083.1 DNA-directed RNA polymerase II subunit RPB7 [Dendrobium catenatum]